MKPPPFDYLVPESLDQALEFLDAHGEEAKLLAGGQSLIPAMNFRLMQPGTLIDINGLSELTGIHATRGGTRIGAITRQSEVERSELVAKNIPLLHEAMPFIAHPQIRNRGTIGGSMVHADPAAELPVIATALEARFHARGAGGDRWIDAVDFFQFMFTTALEPTEMLVEIEFPAMPSKAGWAFTEFSRRRGDYALMGVAAVVGLDWRGRCNHARLVYLNAGDIPVDAREAAGILKGEKPSEQAIEAAAEKAASEEIDPLGNVNATPAYQRHLAKVLTVRALNRAFARAEGK